MGAELVAREEVVRGLRLWNCVEALPKRCRDRVSRLATSPQDRRKFNPRNAATKEALVAMATVENPLRLVRPEANPSFESWRGVPWIEFPAVLRACREAGDSIAATFWERFDAVPKPEAPDHFLSRDEFCAHLVAQTLEECGVDGVFGRIELTLEDVARGEALKAAVADGTSDGVKLSVKGSLAFV